jgi:hypothetical protein
VVGGLGVALVLAIGDGLGQQLSTKREPGCGCFALTPISKIANGAIFTSTATPRPATISDLGNPNAVLMTGSRCPSGAVDLNCRSGA